MLDFHARLLRLARVEDVVLDNFVTFGSPCFTFCA